MHLWAEPQDQNGLGFFIRSVNNFADALSTSGPVLGTWRGIQLSEQNFHEANIGSSNENVEEL